MNLPFSLGFTSWGFFAALALLVALSRLLPRRALPTLLLGASLLYYLALAPAALPILAAATVVVYFCGRLTAKDKGAAAGFGVALALLLLAVTKYLPALLGSKFSIITPLGISYFVFSAISYLCDLRKGKLPPERDFGRLALYLFFFAKITSGPIEKAGDFFASLDELEKGDKPFENRQGFLLILSGCIRKLAISDLLSGAVAAVFDAPAGQSGLAVFGATLCYTLQIYGDFAGYTDLARGSALLLGVPMSENFIHPYAATSIKDFWRRWHISLSSFLRDYVYIPLGGNRKGKARKQLNVLIVFVLSGIWHGVGFTFLLWGLLHGLLQIIEDFLPWREKLKVRFGERSALYLVPSVAVTFLLVAFCWMPFRAADMATYGALLKALAHPGSLSGAWRTLGLSLLDLLTVAAAFFASDCLKKAALPAKIPAKAPEKAPIPKRPTAARTLPMRKVAEPAVSAPAPREEKRGGSLTPAFPGCLLLAAAALLLLFLAAKSGSGGSFIYIGF